MWQTVRRITNEILGVKGSIQGMLENKSRKYDSAFLSDGNGFKRNASSTCAVASISSISGVTRTNIRSFGVHACGIHVTRVISFTLVNICKMINIKEKE